MKTIFKILLAVSVLSLTPTMYVCAQGHIETPAERQACGQLERERAERKKKAGDNYSEGLSRYQDDSGLCGYIDEVGDIVIPCLWKQTWLFSEGLAAVADANDRWGFIDKSGNVVVPCQYVYIEPFEDGATTTTAQTADDTQITIEI